MLRRLLVCLKPGGRLSCRTGAMRRRMVASAQSQSGATCVSSRAFLCVQLLFCVHFCQKYLLFFKMNLNLMPNQLERIMEWLPVFWSKHKGFSKVQVNQKSVSTSAGAVGWWVCFTSVPHKFRCIKNFWMAAVSIWCWTILICAHSNLWSPETHEHLLLCSHLPWLGLGVRVYFLTIFCRFFYNVVVLHECSSDVSPLRWIQLWSYVS